MAWILHEAAREICRLLCPDRPSRPGQKEQNTNNNRCAWTLTPDGLFLAIVGGEMLGLLAACCSFVGGGLLDDRGQDPGTRGQHPIGLLDAPADLGLVFPSRPPTAR